MLEHPDRIPSLIDTARGVGATDLFVQVYRGGRAWFETSLADARPFRAARDAAGADPLAIAAARRARRGPARARLGQRALALAESRRAPAARSRPRRRPGRSARTLAARLSRISRCPRPTAPTTAWARRRSGSTPRRSASRSASPPPSPSWSRAIPSSTACTSTTSASRTCCPSRRARASASASTSATASRRARCFASRRDSRRPGRNRRRTPTPGTPGAAISSRRWSQTLRDAVRGVRPQLEISAAVIPYADRAYLSLLPGLAALARGRAARLRRGDGLHAGRPPAALPRAGLRRLAARRSHLDRPRHLALRARARARARAAAHRARRRRDRRLALLVRRDRRDARPRAGACGRAAAAGP